MSALVAASRNATPMLRPRPVSRFETAGFGAESAEVDHLSEPARVSAAPPRRPAAVDPEFVSTPTVARETERSRREMDRPLEPPPAIAPVLVPAVAATSIAGIDHPEPQLTAAPITIVRHVDRLRDQSADPRQLNPGPVAEHEPASVHLHETEPVGVLVAAPAPLRLAQVASSAALAPVVGPGATSKPDPTVHVTIGRVEVRVAAAAESKPQRASTAPKLRTLDEYGAQRGRAR